MTTAYPLTWPAGWRRTASDSRKQAQFGKTERVSFAERCNEISQWGVK